jgi:hypothetical protein
MRVALGGLIFLIAIEASAQNGLTRTGFDTQVAIPRPIQQAVSIAPLSGRQQEFLIANSFCWRASPQPPLCWM